MMYTTPPTTTKYAKWENDFHIYILLFFYLYFWLSTWNEFSYLYRWILCPESSTLCLYIIIIVYMLVDRISCFIIFIFLFDLSLSHTNSLCLSLFYSFLWTAQVFSIFVCLSGDGERNGTHKICHGTHEVWVCSN